MAMLPIFVADLFPEVARRLVELLRSLSAEEWHLPTVSSHRTVKDIASHLLGGSLRRLSVQRDGYRPDLGQPTRQPILDLQGLGQRDFRHRCLRSDRHATFTDDCGAGGGSQRTRSLE